MPDYSAYLDKHFKFSGLPNPLKLTIREVKLEEVGQQKQSLPVVYFIEDPRGCVMNRGRFNAIAKGVGSMNTDDWSGTVIELVPDPNVTFGGRVTGGIVVRFISKPGA